MKRMNGIYFIIGGILTITAGTFLMYYGQDLRNKDLNDNVKDLKLDLQNKNLKIENLEKWENKVSIRLMESLYHDMCSFYETIQEYSVSKIDTINVESFKVLCKGCDINQKTKFRISIYNNSYYTVREYLLLQWQKIHVQLNEINSASTYVSPEAYDLFLRIKEKGYPITFLSMNTKNTDLESWHDTFFEIYNLTIELNELMKNIGANQK